MKMTKFLIVCFSVSLFYFTPQSNGFDKNAETPAPSIRASAKLPKNHQLIEPKITCSECHTVKYDAESTATGMWVNNYKLFSQDEIWKWIVDFLPARERFVTATTGDNNIPTSSTVDFVLLPDEKIFLSVNEKGTEKVIQLQKNPWISMTHYGGSIEGPKAPEKRFWKSGQVLGKVDVLEPGSEGFEDMLKKYNPARTSMTQSMKRFNMLRVKIHRIMVFDSDNLKIGYSPYQLWENRGAE